MAQKIYPTKTGYIIDEAKNWGKGGHIQGITQVGEKYTILSSSEDTKELILASGDGDRKTAVRVYSLPGPGRYEHAGGIDTLKVNGGWMIVVPVWAKDTEDRGAIILYFFPENFSDKNNKDPGLVCRHIQPLKGVKAYAAGIAQKDNGVVIAVMIDWVEKEGSLIDGDGKKVLFLQCDNLNGIGAYKNLGTWNADHVPISKRRELGWKPDTNWGCYPNSISLINHRDKIYFVGLHGSESGWGKDWVDIYSVDLGEKTDNKCLTKKQNFHAICNHPSFRWGGSAWIQNEKVEILAVERDVQDNYLVRYDKFCLNINPIDQQEINPTVNLDGSENPIPEDNITVGELEIR